MAEEKQYDILTTMHGSFKTTFTKKHLARKPWQPETLSTLNRTFLVRL